MTMSGKSEGVSPVRVSRLKKRRRPKESNDGTVACALQNLTSSSRKNLHNLRQSQSDAASASDDAHGIDGRFKENFINGIPSLSRRTLAVERDTNHALEGKGEGLDRTTALRSAAATRPSLHSSEGGIENELSSPNNNTNKHTLEFLDLMDQSELIAIPYMLDNNMERYKSVFEQDLERSFKYNNYHAGDGPAEKSQYSTVGEKGIYHSLVGRIGPHSSLAFASDAAGIIDKKSIAFPPCRNSCPEVTPQKDPMHKKFLSYLNLERKTEHGMCIPLSWYQFPSPNTQKSPLPENMPVANTEDDRISATTNENEQSASNHDLSLQNRPANGSQRADKKSEVLEGMKDLYPTPEVIAPVNHGREGRKSSTTLERREPPPPPL